MNKISIGNQPFSAIQNAIDSITANKSAGAADTQIFPLEYQEDSYITAARTPLACHFGFIFVNCQLCGEAPKGSVYLGRSCPLGENLNGRRM